ncbi:maleylpyruvate isomerase family mycothiol-dependent enzyme [Kitasatospora sp. NPDC057223]|uniref:maleylpyruvate isomerase family mycothiol-dependent enzyme n=1 Tax=Kitasatospora sp. NPDC057223 TaxID=3346055 RepID=UPI003633F8F3
MIPAPIPRESAHSALLDAVLGVAEETAALLRECPGTDVPIPGAQWTVGEAAAHLALANELMAALAAGEQRAYGDGTPSGLAAANEASLGAFTQRDGAVLAEEITRHARAFGEAFARRPATARVLTPLGPMDLATLGSYLLAHMLGHGYDIAVALGRPHMIDRHRVELTLPFLMTAMPRVVDPGTAAGHTARYDLRLRGGARFTVTFRAGVPEVSPGPAPRADCTILTDPVAFLLLALGRCGPFSALARGKVLAWGRRAWLAPGFPLLFRAP